jgi:hypothetical protein
MVLLSRTQRHQMALLVTIIITNGHCCAGRPHGLEILTSLVHTTHSTLLGYQDNQRLLLKNHGQSPFNYYETKGTPSATF